MAAGIPVSCKHGVPGAVADSKCPFTPTGEDWSVGRSYLLGCMVISGLDRLPPCNLGVESVVSFRPGLPSGQPQSPHLLPRHPVPA
jgi:hypothetical protein